MLTIQLPIAFLKGLAGNPGYTDVWIRWIANYGEKLKDPFFMDWLAKTEQLSGEELKQLQQVYHYGQPYLPALYFIKAKKETKKGKRLTEQYRQDADRVLTYLNLRTGVEYGKVKPEPVLKLIINVLNEGYSIFDCKAVIDKKYQEWHGTDFEKYLRPSTLFNLEKFDTYLNQPIHNGRTTKPAGSHSEQVYDAVKQAIELNHKMGGDKRPAPDHKGH